MSNKISHSGIVESVEPDCLRVRILQTSACGSCKAASHCNAAENKEKKVDVYGVGDTSLYRIGQEVNVTASIKVGMNAVLLAFAIPFIILLAVLFIGSQFIADEAVVALLSIACLIPYYIGLYLMRSKLQERFTFRIE
ncbi:MAG: SoxR reducing system RseC family protein [Prevotella sp.]|nr:SoxR reducing system RseC family protein [Prevotella sp.]